MIIIRGTRTAAELWEMCQEVDGVHCDHDRAIADPPQQFAAPSQGGGVRSNMVNDSLSACEVESQPS